MSLQYVRHSPIGSYSVRVNASIFALNKLDEESSLLERMKNVKAKHTIISQKANLIFS